MSKDLNSLSLILFWQVLSLLICVGCGIETSLPGNTVESPSLPDNNNSLIIVSNIRYLYDGTEVTCEINSALVDGVTPIDVFIEFNGTEIARNSSATSNLFLFQNITTQYAGNLRCVVEYSDSEFESSEVRLFKSQIIANGASGLLFTADGGVGTWGGPFSGGDSINQTGISSLAGYLPDENNDGISDLLSAGVKKIIGLHGDPEYGPTNSYAALKDDGSVVAWGYNLHGGDPVGLSTPPANIKTLSDINGDFIADELSSNVEDVFFSIFSYAALKKDGSVITWGANDRGGDATGMTSPSTDVKILSDSNSDGIADLLSSGVKSIAGSVYAYAALKDDGSVVSWGGGADGGDATGTTTATNHALPDLDSNGIADLLESGVVEIIGGRYSFSAIKDDGSVVSWGHRRRGGDQTQASGDSQTVPLADTNSNGIADLLESNVSEVFFTYRAYCALKTDGSVVAWGEDNEGGDPTHTLSNGGYGYLPDANSNGIADLLESGVVTVQRTRGGFAALKDNGSVVAWGNNGRGGDPTGVSSPAASVKVLSDTNSDFIADEISANVVSLYSNRDAFVAVKSDGQAIVWGNTARGGDPLNAVSAGNVGILPDNNFNGMADALESGVVKIFASEHALAALRSDGSVVAWGAADKGGDPTCAQSPATVHCLDDLNSDGIADTLESGVINVIKLEYSGFIAFKESGEIITWGNTDYGGDIYNASGRTDIGFLQDTNNNLIADILE